MPATGFSEQNKNSRADIFVCAGIKLFMMLFIAAYTLRGVRAAVPKGRLYRPKGGYFCRRQKLGRPEAAAE